MDGWEEAKARGFLLIFFFLVFVSAHCLASCFVDGQSQTAIFFSVLCTNSAEWTHMCVVSCVSCLKLVDAAGPG